jgi:aerotaxis receptor
VRKNLPVTGNEFVVPAGATLLSTTDEKGRITYANETFVQVSGFSAEELIGKAHNIVRHPDMPPEAFADMWRSVQAGQSWTALVKNRRKNGDHYWVRANATPMHRGGRLTGYLSVRTPPTRAEIAAAQALYRRVRSGKAGGLAFCGGLVVRTGMLKWMSAPKLLPTAWRVRLALLAAGTVSAIGMLASGGQLALSLATTGIALLSAAVFIERQVTSPLRRVLDAAKRVAAGEQAGDPLPDRIDELGMLSRTINQSGLNLASLVDDVQGQVDSMHSASVQIATGNSDLASRTEQSAASLEQTASSMEQMTATVRNTAESASQASQLASSASKAADEGGQVVQRVVTTMGEIAGSSRRIGDIIGVIDGIAFQTNILALNAAVEAARAGEQGRGFAVVAAEVRLLARRSAEAAKEIKSLIADSAQRVDDGSRLVADAGTTIGDMVRQFQHVSALIAEITTSSREQSMGITQVGQAVGHLDQITQQNAAMVEQTSAAAIELSEKAKRLAHAVSVFAN